MDEQDKEFETFLRQFHLREHAPFPAEVPVVKARRPTRWILAAAAVFVAVVSLPLVRHFWNPALPGAVVEAAGDSAYKTGETIAIGDVIRSGGFENLLLRLEDGSRVEMRAQSRVVLETAEDGSRIRLNNGGIVVRAAKQRDGHLYVQTSDTLVSVVGTLFLVESLPQGSRVSVFEGEVEVRFGTEVQKLVSGQQVASSSEIELVSLGELTVWSWEVGSLKTLVVGETGAVTGSEEKRREAQREPLRSATREAAAPGQTPEQQPPSSPPPPQPPQEQPKPTPSPEGQQQSDSGRQTFNRACVTCHNDQIARGRQWPSREAVANFVSVEISRGAQVSPPEVQPLVDYIFNNFGVKGARE